MKRGWLLLLIGMFFLYGCGSSQPARFYTLTALAQQAAAPGSPATAADGAVIAVGPVSIPDRLNRPQLVSLYGENEITIADFDRWSGSLREEIGRTVTENLTLLLPSRQVVAFSWGRRLTLDKQVTLDILRMDGTLGREVTLKVNWAILGDGGLKTLLVRRTEMTEAVTGPGYESYVAAQSRVLAKLSREIAANLSSLPEQPVPDRPK